MAAIDFTTVEVWTRNGISDLLLAVRHAAEDSPSPLCRLPYESTRILDETDSSRTNQLCRWISPGQATLDHRPRDKVL